MFTHTGLQAPLNETECSGELNLKKILSSFYTPSMTVIMTAKKLTLVAHPKLFDKWKYQLCLEFN